MVQRTFKCTPTRFEMQLATALNTTVTLSHIIRAIIANIQAFLVLLLGDRFHSIENEVLQ